MKQVFSETFSFLSFDDLTLKQFNLPNKKNPENYYIMTNDASIHFTHPNGLTYAWNYHKGYWWCHMPEKTPDEHVANFANVANLAKKHLPL